MKIPNIKIKLKRRRQGETDRDFMNPLIDEGNETIQLADTKEHIGAIAVSPLNISGIEEKEQTKYINVLETFVNNRKFTNYQIFSSETGSGINTYLHRLSNLQKKMELSNDSNRPHSGLIEDEKKHIQMQTGNRDLVNKYLYIIFRYEDKEELERLKYDTIYLFRSMFSARDMDFYGHLLTIYRYFSPFRSLYGRKNIRHLEDLEACDYISPIGIKTDKGRLSQYIYIGDAYCKTFHIYSYPGFPFLAWLSYLTGFKGADLSLHAGDCDSARLIKTYSEQYNNLYENYDKATRRSEQEKLKNDVESVELTIESLSKGTKKAVSFIVAPRLEASSPEGLIELESLLVQETSNLDTLIRQGFFDQRELFYSSAPLCCNRIKECTKNVVCNVIS